MKGKNVRKKMVILVALMSLLLLPGMAISGGYYHIVKKGDTLWDLCKKYYGNPWLWPKLWEMNAFITNPHLLKPGDKISLLENVPLVQPAAKEEETKKSPVPPSQTQELNWWERGLDVSGLTNVRAIGFFSSEAIDPLGVIIAGETERLILAERDKIIIRVEEQSVHPGDILWVYRSSKRLRDSVMRHGSGFVISILGNVRVTEALKKGLYKAVVNEIFRDIKVGDVLTNYQPISPCVIPANLEAVKETTIVATKDMLRIIGQFSIVYLRDGEEQGLSRGNLFQVYKKRAGLPDLLIGYVLVLDTRRDSAVGVVVKAKEHFNKGAKLRAIEWSKAPRYLAAIPSCS